MIPKEQKFKFFTKRFDGNVFEYINKMKNMGWVLHQFTPNAKDSYYIIFYKY